MHAFWFSSGFLTHTEHYKCVCVCVCVCVCPSWFGTDVRLKCMRFELVLFM